LDVHNFSKVDVWCLFYDILRNVYGLVNVILMNKESFCVGCSLKPSMLWL
jgi:hypothetical protein